MTDLVSRIQAFDPAAMEELYLIFTKGFRAYLYTHLGPRDVDDHLHDVYAAVVQAIQRGEIRNPERLMGYVHTVARYQIAHQIGCSVKARTHEVPIAPALYVTDRTPGPERQAIDKQTREITARVLAGFPRREREVLSRFYLDEQTPARICAEMQLTSTQFRLIKSRSKTRYGQLCRAALNN